MYDKRVLVNSVQQELRKINDALSDSASLSLNFIYKIALPSATSRS